MTDPLTVSDTDLTLLRRTIALAAEARAGGNHPFGALLADSNGNILAEASNTVVTGHDVTGHAELNLVRVAFRTLTADVLSSSTLYTSTEPCAMCSGAIYWLGISRVVYGMSEEALADMTLADVENPTLALPARQVLSAGQREIAVIGPLLADEAAAVHEGFWNPNRARRLSVEAD